MSRPRCLLAIETSSRTGSVAASANGEIEEARLERERAHARDLLPTIDRLLARLPSESQRPDGIVVGNGRGSFTGLRVGIATALGLSRAWEVPILSVPSIEALAFAESRRAERVSIALDARAGRFYYARYERTSDELTTLDAPRAANVDELTRALASNEDVILGDASVVQAAGLGDDVASRVRTDARPRAGALLDLAARRWPPASESRDIEPLYLFSFGE